MSHFSSKPCSGSNCCCSGTIEADGCFIRWTTTDAVAVQVLLNGSTVYSTELNGSLNNPPDGTYTLMVQCSVGGEWSEADSIEWEQPDDLNCCSEYPNDCYAFLDAQGVTEFNLTISAIASGALNSSAITQILGSYVLEHPTGWPPGTFVYFEEDLPSSSVTFPSWGCGGITNPPRFAFVLATRLTGIGSCKMRLYFFVFANNALRTSSIFGNTIECDTEQSGTGQVTLYHNTCEAFGPEFDFTLEAVTA